MQSVILIILATPCVVAGLASAGCATEGRELDMNELREVAMEGGVQIEFVDVAAWENRMPVVGDRDANWPPRHLLLRFLMSNHTSDEKTITVDEVRLSFESEEFGVEAPGITFVDRTGNERGGDSITLPAGGRAVEVYLRGENVFEGGRQNDLLYATVSFGVANGAERTLTVRNEGRVIVAM